VQAASAKPADLQASKAALDAVTREAEKAGLLGHLFEAHLALGNIEMKYGSKADGRGHLAGVERDAAASGFVLIARRAAQARSQR